MEMEHPAQSRIASVLVVLVLAIGVLAVVYASENLAGRGPTSPTSGPLSSTGTSVSSSSSMSSASHSTGTGSGNCSRSSVGLVPLTDMGTGTYEGHVGGLYANGSNSMPAVHLDDGLALAKQVVPLDSSGNPSSSGRVVLISIGMSNNNIIWSSFIAITRSNTSLNPSLVIVNGAEGGQTASRLAAPNGSGYQYWNQWVPSQLSAKGVTALQVQVAWLYDADAGPTGSDISYAMKLSSEFVTILQILHTRFPNLKLVYMSSREYAGYATTPLNPEPYSYASGFTVKWTIEEQINGSSSLDYNSTMGPAKAPWVAWGPYTWADGTKPRSDGLSYVCSDFGSDGTHPSPQGAMKIAELLLSFFSTDPTAKPWFLKNQS